MGGDTLWRSRGHGRTSVHGGRGRKSGVGVVGRWTGYLGIPHRRGGENPTDTPRHGEGKEPHRHPPPHRRGRGLGEPHRHTHTRGWGGSSPQTPTHTGGMGGSTPQPCTHGEGAGETPTYTYTHTHTEGRGRTPQSPRQPLQTTPPSHPPKGSPAQTPQATPPSMGQVHTHTHTHPPAQTHMCASPAVCCTHRDRQSLQLGVGQFYSSTAPPQLVTTVSLIQARTRCTSTYTPYLEAVQVLS